MRRAVEATMRMTSRAVSCGVALSTRARTPETKGAAALVPPNPPLQSPLPYPRAPRMSAVRMPRFSPLDGAARKMAGQPSEYHDARPEYVAAAIARVYGFEA